MWAWLLGCGGGVSLEVVWSFRDVPPARTVDACGDLTVAVVGENALPIAETPCVNGSLDVEADAGEPLTAQLRRGEEVVQSVTIPALPDGEREGRREIAFDRAVTVERACEDGVDEDVDGLQDCDDPDCAEALACIPPCEPAVVISRVYAAGGDPAGYDADFVELHARDARPAVLDGLELLAQDEAGVWQRRAVGGTLEAGAYATFLLRRGGAGTFTVGDGFGPDVDLDGAGLAVALGPVGAVAADGQCPEGFVDLVGIGTAAPCAETAPWSDAVPGPTQTLDRIGGGCLDTDDNRADLVVAPLDALRTLATEPLTCDCG